MLWVYRKKIEQPSRPLVHPAIFPHHPIWTRHPGCWYFVGRRDNFFSPSSGEDVVDNSSLPFLAFWQSDDKSPRPNATTRTLVRIPHRFGHKLYSLLFFLNQLPCLPQRIFSTFQKREMRNSFASRTHSSFQFSEHHLPSQPSKEASGKVQSSPECQIVTRILSLRILEVTG